MIYVAESLAHNVNNHVHESDLNKEAGSKVVNPDNAADISAL